MRLLVEAVSENEQEPIIFVMDTKDISDKVDELVKWKTDFDLNRIKNIISDETFTYQKMIMWLLDSDVLIVTLIQIALLRKLDDMWDSIWEDSNIRIDSITEIWWLA